MLAIIPQKLKDFNLRNIEILKKRFDCDVGLSDHSKENIISTISISLGAKVFEKHIALEGTKSLDAEFSLKGSEILDYRKNLDQSYELIKDFKFRRSNDELKNKVKMLYFSIKDIKKGETFTKENIRIVRPGYGLEPKFFEKLIGTKCKVNLRKDNPILKKHI